MAFACAPVAPPNCAGRCIGLTSFPEVPIWLAGQTMGLGTLYPPHVLWERVVIDDRQLQTCAFWRAAPVITHRGKRKLLNFYDGSNERSDLFPIPFTASSPRGLLIAIAPSHEGAAHSCEHRMVTRSSAQLDYSLAARTGAVTSFRKWFRWRNKTPQSVSQLIGQSTDSTPRNPM